jgi:hypothetical protein
MAVKPGLFSNTFDPIARRDANIKILAQDLKTELEAIRDAINGRITYYESLPLNPVDGQSALVDGVLYNYKSGAWAGVGALESYFNVTNTIYVDIGRTDIYTPNGSFIFPYKSISAALAVAADRQIVVVALGTYIESLSFSSKVMLICKGVAVVGNLTIAVETVINGDIYIVGDVAISANFRGEKIAVEGQMVTSADAEVSIIDLTIEATDKSALIASATSTLAIRITASCTGDYDCILHTAGFLGLELGTAVMASATYKPINSTGGVVSFFGMFFSNGSDDEGASSGSIANNANAANFNKLARIGLGRNNTIGTMTCGDAATFVYDNTYGNLIGSKIAHNVTEAEAIIAEE